MLNSKYEVTNFTEITKSSYNVKICLYYMNQVVREFLKQIRKYGLNRYHVSHETQTGRGANKTRIGPDRIGSDRIDKTRAGLTKPGPD